MERVFAKYENIKNVFEGLLSEESGKLRKLFSDGVIYIFDAENVSDDKDFISHGLNIGIYNDSSKVECLDYLNIVLTIVYIIFDLLRYTMMMMYICLLVKWCANKSIRTLTPPLFIVNIYI